MQKECKRCLLLEAGEKKTYEDVTAYINSLPDDERAEKEVVDFRLSKCRECDRLISGMCLSCGCYVELRAALKNNKCADFDRAQW